MPGLALHLMIESHCDCDGEEYEKVQTRCCDISLSYLPSQFRLSIDNALLT